QEGEDGLLKRTILVRYENGQEVGRSLQKEWVEKDPVSRIILHGTKVIWRTVETSSGPVKYWQKLRMLATSYDASHGGKDPGHPAYGITYTGMVAGRGVVAVDPRVVPLYTQLYVPGYGLAVAGDTGGGIIGDRIDLGFEEGETGLWSVRWVDVYILN
ncbi:MAG: 3D domain-containing protein, partial [Dehalococcoidia bacterium]|nr:3D domain-containing protein [Dehalococcoidia bacterium]